MSPPRPRTGAKPVPLAPAKSAGVRTTRLQPERERLGFRYRDHERCAGILQDADVTRHVVLDRGQPRRRIERHRDATGEQNTIEAVQVFARGGQHDGHCLTRSEPGFREARRVTERGFVQHRVGERILLAFVVQVNRQATGLARDMPFERFGERAGLVRQSDIRRVREVGDAMVGRVRGLARGAEQEAQQIARRFGGRERPLGQAHRELALQAQDQLDSRQAVEPEIPVERAVERDADVIASPGFAHDAGDDLEQPAGIDFLVFFQYSRPPVRA
jgi:hypothetical protein